MKTTNVVYYENELNEDFASTKITTKKIDSGYVYYHGSIFKKAIHFFLYRIIAAPLAFLYLKIFFAHKIIGGKKMHKFKKTGYFIYGNHTQDIADAYIPHMISFTKDKYMIVHPDSVSIPVFGKITPYLGAIPLPGDIGAYRNFLDVIEKHIRKSKAIVIYPEAHIWPYCTHIRPFTDVSFSYPVKLDVPVFCFTNTYHKRKILRTVKITTYVDGPFYRNPELSPREQRKALRDDVYSCMCERAKLSSFEKIKYVKKELSDD